MNEQNDPMGDGFYLVHGQPIARRLVGTIRHLLKGADPSTAEPSQAIMDAAVKAMAPILADEIKDW